MIVPSENALSCRGMEIPASDVKRPERMIEPFARLKGRLRERGISPDVAAESGPVGEAWRSHTEFEKEAYEFPRECPGGGMLRIEDVCGAVWICRCDACGFEVGVNMSKADPERMLRKRMAFARIPEMFTGKTFDSGDPLQSPALQACRQWLMGYRRDPLPAVALWGEPGRGKSHLLALMIATLVKQNEDAAYRSVGQLFEDLQAGMADGTMDLRWERLVNVPFLALDDLAADRLTGWREDRLAALVDHRYAKELPLLLATNVPPHRWDEMVGDRTASRLSGMVVKVKLEGPDRRAQGVQEALLGTEAA